MENVLNSLLPQPPWAGPPLPKILGQKWPWASETQPTANFDPPEYREVAVEDRDIIELHKEGVPAIEIAARLNVAPELARYRLRRSGFEPLRSPKFVKAEERRSDITRLHQEGLPAKEIAKRLGLNWSHVLLRLRQARLQPRPSPEETENTLRALDEIVRLEKEGVPRYEIAKRTKSTWPLVAEALEKSSVKPVAPACGEIAAWAAMLPPIIDEIRKARPDTEPALSKVKQLEKELTAIYEAAHTVEERLPFRGTEADKERVCLGDISHAVYNSLDYMDALKGCIGMLDVEKLPRRLEQADVCVKNISNIMSRAVAEATQAPKGS